MHRAEGGRRLGLGHPNRSPNLDTELVKRLLPKTKRLETDDGHIVRHIEHGQQGTAVALGMDLHLAQRLEALATVDLAVAMEVGDLLR